MHELCSIGRPFFISLLCKGVGRGYVCCSAGTGSLIICVIATSVPIVSPVYHNGMLSVHWLLTRPDNNCMATSRITTDALLWGEGYLFKPCDCHFICYAISHRTALLLNRTVYMAKTVINEFPAKASDAEFWRFLWSRPEQLLRKQSRRRWFETPSQSLWRHCNGTATPLMDTGHRFNL